MSGAAQVHAHEPWNKPCDESCPGYQDPPAEAAAEWDDPHCNTACPWWVAGKCDELCDSRMWPA